LKVLLAESHAISSTSWLVILSNTPSPKTLIYRTAYRPEE